MDSSNPIFAKYLETLATHLPIGTCCLDSELRYTYINDMLSKMNGVPADEHINRHVGEIIPQIIPEIQGVVSQIVLTGQPVENRELIGQTGAKSGIKCYWNTSWYPILDNESQVSGFLVIAIDITEKKLAQDEIRERGDRLIAANEILHAALTFESEGELGLTCLDVIKKITNSQVAFIGEVHHGLLNINISNPGCDDSNSIINEECGPKGCFPIKGVYGKVISEQKSFFANDIANLPDSITFPDGHPPISSFLGVPLFHEGRVFGMIGVGNREGGYSRKEQETIEAISPSVVDAIMRKRAKDELEALNHELEQRVEQRTREMLHAEKLAAIGKLSASIAHEFNSPLQAVMTIHKILGLSDRLDAEERKLLNSAIDESIRMKALIRSLQDFYRPTSNRKVPMDVCVSLKSVLMLFKIDLNRKNIKAELTCAKRMPQIMAVPDQIKQVFLNLLSNAADACQNGGGVVLIRAWQAESGVAIGIQDNGVGIPPENLDKIFQPFFTTKPVVKGTGLGLSVCHGIVQNHGGQIRVESEPGAGSTFTVFLPITGGQHGHE
ncbi:MAG TPA: hypothetical protein DDY32_09530 [Desulfobulbaceae bacterium]|nr:hypothetical protein [Desulfobulbaceae bacterium]